MPTTKYQGVCVVRNIFSKKLKTFIIKLYVFDNSRSLRETNVLNSKGIGSDSSTVEANCHDSTTVKRQKCVSRRSRMIRNDSAADKRVRRGGGVRLFREIQCAERRAGF